MGEAVPGNPASTSAAEPPVRTSLRVVWLVGLVYVIAQATHPGLGRSHLAALLLTVTSGLGWAGWLMARHLKYDLASCVALVVLSASGGGLVVLHPIGVAVVGLAGMCAASLFDVLPAAALTAPALVAVAVGVAVTGHSADAIASAASGAAAGLVIGMGRRQSQQRARQEAELVVAAERAQVEHERAEVLAERNRIAREVHDVLAHTLSALSVQMEALASVVDGDERDMRAVRESVARSRGLVTEGLEETRRAVRVLRDEPVDAVEQISGLADAAGATMSLDGRPRPLPPACGLALVRVAQEALTNARKHAVGAPVALSLSFTERATVLTVENPVTEAAAIASTGSGYGLQGMRERLELVGGRLAAGRGETGCWRVEAELPA